MKMLAYLLCNTNGALNNLAQAKDGGCLVWLFWSLLSSYIVFVFP